LPGFNPVKDTLFDEIDARYDFLNHLLSLYMDVHWRRVMVRELLPLKGPLVLDLATGTGDSASGLLKEGLRVVGLDISFNMLLRAKDKIRSPYYNIITGSGYTLPFKDRTFDGLTCAFGIRNMHRTPEALKETYRVLRKGGKAVFLEFAMPRGFIKGPYMFYLKKILPNMAALFSNKDAYVYLGDSIEAFHRPDEFRRLMTEAGFVSSESRPLCIGNVYVHKGWTAE